MSFTTMATTITTSVVVVYEGSVGSKIFFTDSMIAKKQNYAFTPMIVALDGFYSRYEVELPVFVGQFLG